MKRLRLAIKKEEALQFLSHLDFARVVRLVVVRAALPVCYSEGFNPHMKLSFASALGVGVSASVEYMDIELTDEIPVTDIISRMVVYVDAALRNYYDVAGFDSESRPLPAAMASRTEKIPRVYIAPFTFTLDDHLSGDLPYMAASQHVRQDVSGPQYEAHPRGRRYYVE